MSQFKNAIVIGASSGIGAEITKQLVQQRCKVAVVARRMERLQKLAELKPGYVLPFEHDVKDYPKIPELFQEITQQLGGLDLIVYAAGVMPEVGPSEYNFEKDCDIMEVNTLGAMAWLNQAATRMQNTKHGSIVALGSVAGDRGRSGQPAYNTSKAALATYMEALRNRLAKRGVSVVTIKPGPTDTEMTRSLHLKGALKAADVAKFTLAKANKTGEHYVKFSHRLAFCIIRNTPSWIFRKMKI